MGPLSLDGEGSPPRPAQRSRTLEPAELAWVAALPCALVVLAAVVLLGPALGRALLSPGAEGFWPSARTAPEPTEHARYVIAALGPALLTALVLVGTRRRLQLRPASTRIVAAAAQATAVSFLVVCVLAQHDILLRSHIPPVVRDQVFTWPTLGAAAALVALLLAIPRRSAAAARIVKWTRETRTCRIACLVLAGALTATWLLSAINTDGTITHAPGNVLIPWDMSETFAVLDGRTPLVDFHAQYANLWPYLAAAIMALLGSATVGVWTTLMASISGLALLAVYAVFRRILRSSLLALALYVPFLATGFFIIAGSLANRFGPASIYSLWPLRFAGPYLLAWLTARHLDRVAPRRTWLLLLAGGLVVLNNPEFGAGALAATLVAIACCRPPRSWRAARGLLAAIAAGVLGAAALVSLLSLARAGALPDFASLLEFPRIYGLGGWVLEPMAPMGLHLALYATFAAAIVTAVVRALRGDVDRVLTGMLAWSGVFGLVAGGYYVGRSDQLNLISLFSPWCLSLSLLLVVVVRSLTAHAWRRPTLAELAVLFGLGLMLCSLPQVPTPWSQIARLSNPTGVPIYEQLDAREFVARATHPGEKVAILIPLGHRIAYDLGLTNVVPYAGIESMPTQRQMRLTLDVLRRAHVHEIFLSAEASLQEQLDAITQAGFTIAAHRAGLYELTDAPGRAR